MKNIKVAKSRLFLLTLVLISTCVCLSAQDTNSTTFQQQYELEYAQRIKKTHINGRYIPKDLDEALQELDRIVESVGKAKFKAQPEEVAVKKVHFSFGKWIIVNWGFYEGSRLSHFLKSKGIAHPDDMASTLMICFHRYLNQRPLEFDALASDCEQRRKKEIINRLQRGQIIETRSVPKKLTIYQISLTRLPCQTPHH